MKPTPGLLGYTRWNRSQWSVTELFQADLHYITSSGVGSKTIQMVLSLSNTGKGTQHTKDRKLHRLLCEVHISLDVPYNWEHIINFDHIVVRRKCKGGKRRNGPTSSGAYIASISLRFFFSFLISTSSWYIISAKVINASVHRTISP